MKRKKALNKKIALTLAASALICSGQVFAEEEDTVFQLDQVTVTADRTASTVGQTAANVTVITGEEIENKGARTLADALTGVSGVTVQKNGGAGEFSNVYVMGSDRVVVLVDGKRMNLPQGTASGHGIDFSTILIDDNIERIEVVRGGASVLYGADAVGGVINIITKKGDGPTWMTANVAVGNYGSRNFGISAGGQEGNTRWRLSGMQDSTDGQRDNSDYKGKDVSFRLDHDLNKSESLTFTYDYYGSHLGLPGYNYDPRDKDFSDTLRRNWSMGYTKEHDAGSQIFRYYANSQTYSVWEYYYNYWEPPYGNVEDYSNHKNTVKVFEYQDSARLNEANSLTWGGEWRKETVESNKHLNTSHDGTTKALFIQNQYNINSVSKLDFGLRWNDNSVYGTQWLPKISYLYQSSPSTTYFANWGKVFKAPTFDDLYADYGGMGSGNPDLKPETGWTAEIGVKSKINDKNEAALSIFKRDLNDAIDWAVDASGSWKPSNVDRLKSTGVTASLISVFSPTITTNVGYTYLNSHDQNNASVGDPRHSFHIGINIHSGKWKQGVYGIYQDQTGTDYSQIGGYFIVNTNTTYSINKEASLFLTINNLLNKNYEAVKDYPANKFNYLFGLKYSM